MKILHKFIIISLLALTCEVLYATSATEPFTGSGSLSASWTNGVGTAIVRNGNVAESTITGIDQTAWYNTGTWGNDQTVTIVQTATPPASSYVGPCVRASGTGGSFAAYCVITGGNYSGVGRYSGGVFTEIQASATHPTDGVVLSLDVTGTTLTAKYDGNSWISTTDSNIASGNPGFYMFSGSAAPAQADDFTATDGSGGAVATPKMTLMGVGDWFRH